jgi:hypothetical protein
MVQESLGFRMHRDPRHSGCPWVVVLRDWMQVNFFLPLETLRLDGSAGTRLSAIRRSMSDLCKKTRPPNFTNGIRRLSVQSLIVLSFKRSRSAASGTVNKSFTSFSLRALPGVARSPQLTLATDFLLSDRLPSRSRAGNRALCPSVGQPQLRSVPAYSS